MEEKGKHKMLINAELWARLEAAAEAAGTNAEAYALNALERSADEAAEDTSSLLDASGGPLRAYTAKQAAALLGITTRTLMTYIHEGKIKAVRIGRTWRITPDNLQAFVRGE